MDYIEPPGTFSYPVTRTEPTDMIAIGIGVYEIWEKRVKEDIEKE